MTAPHLGPGHAIAGRYTVRALLGFTGDVATYHAVADDGAEVVIRLHDPELGQRADVMALLEHTRALVGQLPGDSVVSDIDAGFDVGTGAPYTVAEYQSLPSLQALLETAPLSPDAVLIIIQNAARVLESALMLGLFHHALKPTNIFVGPAPHYPVRISDFAASVTRAASPTHDAYARGAPWWAPEQLQPGATVGAAADVFSLALIMFFALSRRSFWASCQLVPPDLPGWQHEVMGARPAASQRAAELGSVFDPALDELMERTLSVDPNLRPQRAGELAAAMSAAFGRGSASDNIATLAIPEGLDLEALAAASAPAAAGLESGADAPYGLGDVSGSGASTPGLPPFPPEAKKKKGGAVVPVIIGVVAAVLLGSAGAYYLFYVRAGGYSGAGTPMPTASAPSTSANGQSPDTAETAGGPGPGGAAGSGAAAGAGGASRGAGGSAAGGGGAAAAVAEVAVSLECKPACDDIFVDGKRWDRDEPLKLSPGRHKIKAVKRGYVTATETIVVAAEKPFEKRYKLRKRSRRPKKSKPPCGQFLQPCK